MSKQSHISPNPDPRKDKEKNEKKPHEQERDIILSPEDARSGGPADASVGGEEDAGAGLEFLVRKEKKSEKNDE